MNISIRLIDDSLPMPEYHTAGAAGFDLYSRENLTIEPGEVVLIPSNLIVKVPDGHVLILMLRSSTPRRKGLLTPGGVGVIDSDYCGEKDEIMLQVLNFTKEPVLIERGERIGQGVILPFVQAQFTFGLEAGESRGGFGSTGH